VIISIRRNEINNLYAIALNIIFEEIKAIVRGGKKNKCMVAVTAE